MDVPHMLVIPYPAQGHVKPLMELSHCLVEHGFKVTFLNTEFNHRRVVSAMSSGLMSRVVKFVWQRFLTGHLEEFIRNVNDSDDIKFRCVIADWTMGWAFKVAAKMGIPRAAFWPGSGALMASVLNVNKLMADQIIDANGVPYINQVIQLSPTMPLLNTDDLVWMCMGDPSVQQSIFDLILKNNSTMELIDYFMCNSSYELEQPVFELFPHVRPIGPILSSSSRGNFWAEDSTCLSWLDQQMDQSVVYVAFGSFTVFNKQHFEELALGLELSGKPFLWVVRPDLMSGEAVEYPVGFIERVASRGRMVSWAPQKDVLAHPSIACFLTHCGWNSTLEGLSMGVPFLCWPYFADQFLNRTYICDVWKVGLKLKRDKSGVILRDEIKTKVDVLFQDEEIKSNSKKLKEWATRSVSHGGASLKNLEDFMQKIK
ncbi:hypothetical protein Sjap_015442 [Stephania japonica]|uniref:Glycosyltransferase n=1 Tax=Stephania japonica TaxID=461633 RepID=A0AAP0IJK7_9MAGN